MAPMSGVYIPGSDVAGPGGILKSSIVAGAAAYVPLAVPGIRRGDQVIKCIELPASGAAVDRLAAVVESDHRGTKASLTTAMTGTNNDLFLRAKNPGTGGNAITITLVDPPGNNVPLSVAVVGTDITVTLATDGASAIVSTAAQVIAALMAHPAASALIDAQSPASDTGASVVTALAQTPLAGGLATPAGTVVLSVATAGNQVLLDWLQQFPT